MNDQRPTSVYVARDSAGKVLYVGITARGHERQDQHALCAEWWTFVAAQSVEHYPNRQEAVARESDLIAELLPPFNKDQNSDHSTLRAAYYGSAGLPIPVKKANPESPQVLRLPRGPDRLLSLTETAYRLKMRPERLASMCSNGRSPVACAQRTIGRRRELLFSEHSLLDHIEALFVSTEQADVS